MFDGVVDEVVEGLADAFLPGFGRRRAIRARNEPHSALLGKRAPRLDAVAYETGEVDRPRRWCCGVGAREREETVDQTGQALHLGESACELRLSRRLDIAGEILEA